MMRSVQEGSPPLADTPPSHSDTKVSMGTGHCPTSSKVLLKPFPGRRKFPGLELLGSAPQEGGCALSTNGIPTPKVPNAHPGA